MHLEKQRKGRITCMCFFFSYHFKFNNALNCYSKEPASQEKEFSWFCLSARSIMRANTLVSINTTCLVFSLLVKQC